MDSEILKVDIRPSTRPGPVRAYADVRMDVPGGEITVYGFSVVQKDGKPPFIGFPSKPGSVQGRYFPVFEAEGEVREAICEAILAAHRQMRAR
jgi:hypothetical protein